MLGNIERAFYVGSTIILVCSVYLITMYRETLTTFKKDGSLLSSANPLQSFGVLFQNKFTTRMSILLILINIANQGFFSSIIHYNQYRFKFDSKMNGIYMMAIGVGTAIVQGFFMRKIIPKLGEMKTLRYCYILHIVFFACMSYTADKTAALALAVLFTVAGMADPIQQGLMSQEVKKEDQGKLQGGLSALALLCKVVAAVSMSSAFKYFTSDHAPVQLPSISFIFGTVLAIVSTFVVYSFPAKVDKEKSQ
jgi:DHA1 family tetracycline resistance protein-like MFS transporter